MKKPVILIMLVFVVSLNIETIKQEILSVLTPGWRQHSVKETSTTGQKNTSILNFRVTFHVSLIVIILLILTLGFIKIFCTQSADE